MLARTRRTWSMVLTGLLVVLLGLPVAIAPAAAADPEFLSLTKDVSRADLAPGDSYSYRVQVACSEQSCLDAVLVDTLGQLTGHELTGVELLPGDPGLTYDVAWVSDGVARTSPPTMIAPDTAVTVAFTQTTTSPAGTGMQSGQTFTLRLELKVPEDLAPGDSGSFDNVATVDASNSAPATDTATVRVVIPTTVDVTTTKTWTPATQVFEAGATSTVALTARNASNVPVHQIVVQEPQTAPDGATTLDPSNPFTIVDLTSLSVTDLPTNCTATVDAYVRQGGVWTWVAGAGGLGLPAGVDPGDVAGVRVTCEGDLAIGTTLDLSLGLELRATHRESGDDLSVAEHAVDNVAVGGVVPEAGATPVTRTATAGYRVEPPDVGVALTKSFSPALVTAGESTTIHLRAENTSDVAVSELWISEPFFFQGTAERVFGGFDRAPEWPDGATTARVHYSVVDGSGHNFTFEPGDTPAAPAPSSYADVTAVEIQFTGSIQAGARAGLELRVDTLERAEADVRGEVEYPNMAGAVVEAPNGRRGVDSATATLTVVPASIVVEQTKTVRPGVTLRPGDRAVTELRTDLAVSSSYVTADELVITDAWDGSPDGFWNAFDLEAIAPTQIPSGTAAAVELQSTGGDWHVVHEAAASPASWLLVLDAADLAEGLPGGVDLADVTGVRFTLENASGFSENTTVTPYLVTTARDVLRTGEALPEGTTDLTNTAAAAAAGETAGGTPVEGDAAADDGVAVEPFPPGQGPVGIDKAWSHATVAAQSGQERTTTLTWRVGSGFERVALDDPGDDPASVGDTVFDAFDLVRIASVDGSEEPFTNGWYLRYDDVTAVELYLPDGTDGFTWQAVRPPAGGWMQGGGFVGHDLTSAQRADAQGVRLVLEENAAARVAARQPGAALDPFAPAPGTGVTSSATERSFDLAWQVREKRRSDDAWVTASTTYNGADAGAVENSTQLTGTRSDDTTATATDGDVILVTDTDPLVRLSKTVSAAEALYVPRPDTVADEDWPTRTFTVTAENDSVARASYVRVTDPACSSVDVAACALADPTADPFGTSVDWLGSGTATRIFDRFDLVDVEYTATRPAEVDSAASTVWLLRYDDGTLTTDRTTLAALTAMTADELSDVIGVSVTYQGTDPDGTGGTITPGNELTLTLETRLRPTFRSTGDEQVLRSTEAVDVRNFAYAQSYDPVLNTGPDAVVAAATDVAAVRLTGGVIDVAARKSVSPTTVTEPARDVPVTVTLGVGHGTSTLAPAEVRLRDDISTSPQFWDEFDLVGLGPVTMPAGADRVRADVYGPFGTDDALTWVEGTPASAATFAFPVPAALYGDVQGVRFTFDRADGAFFSPAMPAPAWSGDVAFDVRVRDVTRADGRPIELTGSDRTVENTVLAQSYRVDGEVSQERARAALVTLSEGTHRLSVSKLANNGNRTVDVGSSVPWDLTFENTGTGFLTVSELRDELPPSLLWTGATPPVVTTDADGLMSDQVTVTTDAGDLVLTWPEDGRTLRPDEQVSVRLMLELQPGLGEGDRAVNTMTVRTDEVLDACAPLEASRPVTSAWADDPTLCGTTDHVTPRAGANLFTVKGVRGAVPGAVMPDGVDCVPSLTATGGSYYRTPCVAASVVDGVDDWVLRVVNGGTTSVDELTVFDQLAAPGDTFIVSGSGRGSTHRPQVVDGSLDVTAPAGATVVTEVTTSPVPCVGTWSGLTTGAVCEQNGETWQPAGPATDWSTVTGLRVHVDLTTSTGGALRGGESVDITFSTRNVLETDVASDGVPATVAADDVVAWNQFGVKYRDTAATTFKRIAPAHVGVQVATGPIEVRKAVEGAAVAYAPDAFTAELVCTVGGTPLDLGASALLTFDADNDFAVRLDGIPVGAECDVVETGLPGEFGEAERVGTAQVTVTEAAAASDAVPADQSATLTNTYAFSGLSVTKQIDTEATLGDLGPFEFALACAAAVTGETILFDGDERLTFTLRGGETFSAPAGTIPARALCDLHEVDSSGADTVVVVGDGVTMTDVGRATVEVGVAASEVTVTNGFDAGVLEVRKVVDGDGAGLWGGGPFGFAAVCTYGDETVLDEDFALAAGAFRTFGTFPVGTECDVRETATSGATRTSLDPADGTVVIGAPVGDELVSVAVVTVTNTFDVTSVEVIKVVEGAPTAVGAAGPFTVELVCTMVQDGREVALDVPGGAERVLSAPALTATYSGLLVGSDCVLTEVDTGGADRVRATVEVDGADPVESVGVEVSVVGLATSTGPGQVRVGLVNEFDPPAPVEPGPDDAGGAGDAERVPAHGDALARTGGAPVLIAVLAMLLLTVGAGLVRRSRREVVSGAEEA